MENTNPKVDQFVNNASHWKDELVALREIVLSCGLQEELKWKQPCYTHNTKNIVIYGGFKEYCSLNFIKGALLKDEHSLLVRQTDNVQSGRQLRFTNLQQIEDQKAIIKAYLFEAIEVEKAGLKVPNTQSKNLDLSEELVAIMDKDAEFKTAFNALTPGRQRGYNLFFTAAKQSKTRASRVESNVQRIKNGFGLNDCTCGHSKRKPTCDGSHKYL